MIIYYSAINNSFLFELHQQWSVANYQSIKQAERPNRFITHMESQCFICTEAYDIDKRHPWMLCIEQHHCCFQCALSIFQKQDDTKCPQCRININRKNLRKLRSFELQLARSKELNQLKQNHERERRQLKEMQDREIQLIKEIQERERKLLNYNRNIVQQVIRNPVIISDDTLAEFKKIVIEATQQESSYKNSAQLLQAMIEKVPDTKDKFIGLGSKQEQKGFCQGKGFDWYQQKYSLSQLSLYDQFALCNLLKPDYPSEKEWYQKMIAKDPQNYKALYGLALTQHNNGNINNALKLYKNVISINPDCSKPYEMIAFIYHEEGSFIQAAIMSSECLMREPENIFAMFIKAWSEWAIDKQNVRESLRKLKQIIEKEPQYLKAVYTIAFLQHQLKNDERAAEMYKRCIESNYKPIKSTIFLAQCLLKMGRSVQAVQRLQKIQVKQVPQSYLLQYYRNFGLALKKEGYYKEAVPMLHRYLELATLDVQIRQKLGDMYVELKHYKQGLAEYQRCSSKQKKNYELVTKIADCYIRLKQYSQAIVILENLQKIKLKDLRTMTSSRQLWNLLSIAYANTQQYDASLDCIQKCIENGYNVSLRAISAILTKLVQNGEVARCLGLVGCLKKYLNPASEESKQVFNKSRSLLQRYGLC